MDDNEIIIDFAGAKDYVPYEGGAKSDMIPPGYYRAEIIAIAAGLTKKKEPKLTFTQKVVDGADPTVKGATLVKDVAYTGMKATNPPEKKIYDLFRVFTSAGIPLETIQKWDTSKFKLAQVRKALLGKVVHVEVDHNADKEKPGVIYCNVENYLKPDYYAKLAESGSLKKIRSSAEGQPAGTGMAAGMYVDAAPTASAGGVATPATPVNGTAAPASDFDALMGMGG